MSKALLEKRENAFLERVATANNRILLLDYDGTVAPFHSDRQRAYPYPRVPELLSRIMTRCRTRLIIISERAAHEVAPLLGLDPPPEIWGSHGLERLNPSGRREEIAVNEEALQMLGSAETLLDRAGLGNRIEVKLAAVAIHWRGLAPSEVLKIRTNAYRALKNLASHPHLVLAEFEQGLEIRLESASKGAALARLFSEIRPDVPVAYLGDDVTDEEAFRVLNDRGLTVLVRSRPRFSAAQVWLRPPDELIHFLSQWIKASRGEA